MFSLENDVYDKIKYLEDIIDKLNYECLDLESFYNKEIHKYKKQISYYNKYIKIYKNKINDLNKEINSLKITIDRFNYLKKEYIKFKRKIYISKKIKISIFLL